jgi:hypothetical protein
MAALRLDSKPNTENPISRLTNQLIRSFEKFTYPHGEPAVLSTWTYDFAATTLPIRGGNLPVPVSDAKLKDVTIDLFKKLVGLAESARLTGKVAIGCDVENGLVVACYFQIKQDHTSSQPLILGEQLLPFDNRWRVFLSNPLPVPYAALLQHFSPLRTIVSRLRHLDSALASDRHPMSFVLDQLLDSPWSSITLTHGRLDLQKKRWSLQFGVTFHSVARDLIGELRRTSRVLGQLPGGDLSAYKPAKNFFDLTHRTYNHIRRALDQHPCIRNYHPLAKKTGKPNRHRLLIHAGDWMEYLKESKDASTDPLDLSAERILEAVEDVEHRKAQEQARKEATG